MPIAFDRNICCNLDETISREWLITNGLGGYAAGTVAGVLTRMQHGLLVASTPELQRNPRLLLAKIDEEIVFDQRTYYLGTNEYRDGTLNPAGFVHLETFRLEEGFPVFTYHLGGIEGTMLEKRIWMPRGQNTTYIQYRLVSSRAEPHYYSTLKNRNDAREMGRDRSNSSAAQRAMTLALLPFSAYRPYQQPQHGNNDWHFQVQVHNAEGDSSKKSVEEREDIQELLTLPKGVTGCTIRAWDGAFPYHIFAVGHPDSHPMFIPTNVWYWNVLRRHDQSAGRPAIDDLYLPGVIRATLWPGEDSTLTVVVTAEELSSLTFNLNNFNQSYKRSVEDQRSLLQPEPPQGGPLHFIPSHPNVVAPLVGAQAAQYPLLIREEEHLRLMLQACERFLIRHRLPRNEQGRIPLFLSETEHITTILSDFYSLGEATRDMLIALPGVALATKHSSEARLILLTLARYFKQGLLPDRLPRAGEDLQALQEHDYGSVDTTLWYFYALDQYLQVTSDYELLDELYPRLVDSLDWYRRGTSNGIQVDPNDGLLRAQHTDKALTWMNATIHGIPVTPRQGKPVEVNALWYNALSLMHEWSQRQYQLGHINQMTSTYQEQSEICRRSFRQRFWYAPERYLYDVVDGPEGNDATFRVNQLLALSLRYPILDKEYRHDVFEQITQRLVTPLGLRTLAPEEATYRGKLPTNEEEQQRALHQGSAWPWLIGPYIDALFALQPVSSTPTHAEKKRDREYVWRRAFQMLEPFRVQFQNGLLGMIGGAYDGDSPNEARYQLASALSIGEILRVYHLLAYADRIDTYPVGPVGTRTKGRRR